MTEKENRNSMPLTLRVIAAVVWPLYISVGLVVLVSSVEGMWNDYFVLAPMLLYLTFLGGLVLTFGLGLLTVRNGVVVLHSVLEWYKS